MPPSEHCDMRPETAEKCAKVVAYRATGMTYRDALKKAGIGSTTYHNYCHRNDGIKNNKKPKTPNPNYQVVSVPKTPTLTKLVLGTPEQIAALIKALQ